MAVSSMSHAIYVNDDYVGQDFGSSENTDDATQAKFNISGMDYETDATSVTFTLRASETDNGFGTESYFSAWVNDDTSFWPGDLFLSTDGWSPFLNGTETQAGYGFDGVDFFSGASNGEDWEYVIQLSGQKNGFDPQGSGTTQLYNTADGGEINNGSIRTSQEALYDEQSFDGDNNNPLGAGSWNIFDSNSNGIEDSMSITMLLSAGFQDVIDEAAVNAANNGISIEEALGFHWTMSCGNDVIEGVLPAPVPAAVWLFGSGLLGLVGIARRRNKA
jgi:hypothetical protein